MTGIETADAVLFREAVMITYLDENAVWDCYHIAGPNNEHLHAEFDTRDDAIAWGKSRCSLVRVWDPTTSTAPAV